MPLDDHRRFYAELIAGSAGIKPHSKVAEAFASTPREHFVGDGPWRVMTPAGYITTASANPALLYQDILIGLKEDGPVNNGQPSLHALCLETLGFKGGEAVAHIGAGTGYYTALLAKLTGEGGSVTAFEIDGELARKASENLRTYGNVMVEARSGAYGPIPDSDIIYVNAGATAPLAVWLDALRPEGRLLFPLTPDQGFGGMLLIARRLDEQYVARFLCRAMFIACVGARDEERGPQLNEAFASGDFGKVRSLQRNDSPDGTCWVAGKGWWLSTAPVEG